MNDEGRAAAGHASVTGPVLHLDVRNGVSEAAEKALKALASRRRLGILELLRDSLFNVTEIAEALEIPVSTANLHIGQLEEAGLILTELQPGTRGLQKICARAYDRVIIQLPHGEAREERAIELSMPVGSFVDAQVAATCGLVGRDGIIGLFDDPGSFYEPGRLEAQLIWFHHGYVEYRFPNRGRGQEKLAALQFSLELCSEAPLHHRDWPSDITLWVNDIEVGTWTCPADFGGERGLLTPHWWEEWNSQYGLLKTWQVKRDGSYIDGRRLSDVTLREVELDRDPYIAIRIGVKSDARNVGGLNIFGRHFGNYPQDVRLRLLFDG